MKGLIDLLPSGISTEKKAEYIKKLEYCKKTKFTAPPKTERKVTEFYSEAIRKKAKKAKVIKLSKKKQESSQGKLSEAQRRSAEKKRQLAKQGIIIYEGAFGGGNTSFYSGRKRSLEWNDNIALGTKFESRCSIKKKKLER
ncbi:hypothetical protein J6X90_03615 [Candidatus Saccharibacteria bacterium]|nr:hypothetical protein [Candidatus Saccharibacteria bacterium]